MHYDEVANMLEKETNMTLITAHSGCDQTADNSIEFVQYALEKDIDAIEVDVRKNKQGELVLAHDATEEEVPFLANAFEILKNYKYKKMNCDLKEAGLEESVFALAKAYGVENQLIYSGTVDLKFATQGLETLKGVDLYLNLEILVPEIESGEDMAQDVLCNHLFRGIEEAAKLNITCINMNYRLCVDSVVDYMARHDVAFSAWTVNEVAEIERLTQMGALNITTRNVKGALNLASVRGE